MSEPFAPPRGQRCGNCLCSGPDTASAANSTGDVLCHLEGRSGCVPRRPDDWCGHWRGNKDILCDGCAHFRAFACPRRLMLNDDRGSADFGPQRYAFACERWEEGENANGGK